MSVIDSRWVNQGARKRKLNNGRGERPELRPARVRVQSRQVDALLGRGLDQKANICGGGRECRLGYSLSSRRHVERAKQLLQGGDYTLAQVSARAGFSNQSVFTQHFKRLVGVTPERFRTPATIG
jgi:AraC-like DNA-binding protein